MKREIKFRGKRADNGEWVYGYLYQIELPKGLATIILVGDKCGVELFNDDRQEYNLGFKMNVDMFLVDKETVGQFTGLHDKNGKEIYDGDVVKYNGSHWIYTIEFENCGFKLYRPDGYFYSPDKKDIIEVIGNIYKKNEQTQTIKQ